MEDVIRFNYNYNNKLSCKRFTTLRLKDVRKYQVGKSYRIELRTGKNEYRTLCYASCIDIHIFTIDRVNEFVAGVDTGYSANTARRMLMTMYKNIVKDWSTQPLMFILLEKNEVKSTNTKPQYDTAECY